MDIPDPTVRDLPPEAWGAARRAAARMVSPLMRVLAVEASSGILLIVASVVALVWANSPWAGSYAELWHAPIGIRIGGWSFVEPLHVWVNDGLMTVFFFVVGLEIRREIYEGELATFRQAALPLAAALGGMLVPAVIYAALNSGRAGAAGWGIPMATDIAFAIGVLTLLGSRVPTSLRILLLALAVIDDLGAILVIAIFYTQGFDVLGLAVTAAGVAGVLALRALGVRASIAFVIPGLVMWAGLYVAGIHPTLAGVLLGLLTPVRSWFGPSGFAAATHEHLDDLDALDRDALAERLGLIERARREAVSPAERLLHVLHPWVAFGIMPLFALANAGVALASAELGGDAAFVFLGIVAGLVVGKPLGIFALSAAATRARLASRAPEMSSRGVALVGMVGGIGFTMSLFIAQLAFPPGPLLDTAKLAILVASGTASVVGIVFGVATLRARI